MISPCLLLYHSVPFGGWCLQTTLKKGQSAEGRAGRAYCTRTGYPLMLLQWRVADI